MQFFVADKLFTSTRLDCALKTSTFITYLYRTVLKVNYLLHAESARNHLLKTPEPAPQYPGDRMVAP